MVVIPEEFTADEGDEGMRLRLLLAEAAPRLAAELAQTLPKHDLELVGDASERSRLLPLIDETRPDCVLLDLHVPDLSGLERLAAIREHDLALKAVIYSDIDDPDVVAAALVGGADAYVLTSGCTHDQLALFLLQLTEGTIFEPLDQPLTEDDEPAWREKDEPRRALRATGTGSS